MRRKKSVGTTLSEYALIFGLLIITAIPALMLLGNTTSFNLENIMAAMQSGPLAAIFGTQVATNPTPPLPSPPIGGGSAGTGGGTPSTGTGSAGSGGSGAAGASPITSASPVSLSTNFNPQTGQIEFLIKSGQGAGTTSTSVAGNTNQMMADLITMASELVKAGEITPQQEADLIALANQGHRIAEVEGVIEAQLAIFEQTNASVAEMQNTKIDWNGQQYTMLELSTMIGCRQDCVGITQLGAHNSWAETAAFANLFKEAQQSGAMNNPTVEALVTGLSTDIINMSDRMESIMGWTLNTQPKNGDEPQNAAQLVTSLNNKISRMTHMSSGTICSNGGGSSANMSVSCS
ncbi:MAG: hypothetical protein KTR14_05780 [Vampirovibrio sp.]|nr:hypothetical protein [Vampirovibrio sp.]